MGQQMDKIGEKTIETKMGLYRAHVIKKNKYTIQNRVKKKLAHWNFETAFLLICGPNWA